jgi:ankyrin repeat protein
MAGMDDDVITLALRIFDTAREGRTEELAGFLDRGVPVDFTTPNGDTLLMVAAFNGHADTVQMLLDRGADHTRVNKAGDSALDTAVLEGHGGVMRALLAAGASPAPEGD